MRVETVDSVSFGPYEIFVTNIFGRTSKLSSEEKDMMEDVELLTFGGEVK